MPSMHLPLDVVWDKCAVLADYPTFQTFVKGFGMHWGALGIQREHRKITIHKAAHGQRNWQICSQMDPDWKLESMGTTNMYEALAHTSSSTTDNCDD